MKYRQLAHRLRITRPGKPDKVSERPREGSQKAGWGRFLDDDKPTLITIEPGDQVDVAFLLQVGAIAELPAKRVKDVC